MNLSKRVSTLTPSTTLAITAKAKALKESGVDVIGLGAGEPDFPTPKHIVEAAYKSMLDGKMLYTPAGGVPQLKQVIIDKLKSDQGLDFEMSEVMVGSGAKHVLYLIFQALLDEGDEVIIPTPYWVSYPEQVLLADGKPVYVDGVEENDFKITPEQLEATITDKTRAVIINSPSNPSGMLYTADELKLLGEVCMRHGIVIISDEIYEKLTYGGHKHVSIAELSPELKALTVIVNGVSKSHAMTGWRIGYAAGNKKLIAAMTNLASHSTSNPTTTSQYAAIAAYEAEQTAVEEMRVAFEQRLNVSYEKLARIPGFTCVKPQGAFYLLPNVAEAAKMTGCDNVDHFVTRLLEEANVAVVPGSGFGTPNHIRLSYATSQDNIDKAIERIEKFIVENSK